jgi:hypothetical protein
MTFHCSICEEESTKICVACTKDSCDNHLCEKCWRCSDCCGCEVALNETEHVHAEQLPGGQVTIIEEHITTMSAGGSNPLLASESLVEPSGIPTEDVPGEAADEEISG